MYVRAKYADNRNPQCAHAVPYRQDKVQLFFANHPGLNRHQFRCLFDSDVPVLQHSRTVENCRSHLFRNVAPSIALRIWENEYDSTRLAATMPDIVHPKMLNWIYLN